MIGGPTSPPSRSSSTAQTPAHKVTHRLRRVRRRPRARHRRARVASPEQPMIPRLLRSIPPGRQDDDLAVGAGQRGERVAQERVAFIRDDLVFVRARTSRSTAPGMARVATDRPRARLMAGRADARKPCERCPARDPPRVPVEPRNASLVRSPRQRFANQRERRPRTARHGRRNALRGRRTTRAAARVDVGQSPAVARHRWSP